MHHSSSETLEELHNHLTRAEDNEAIVDEDTGKTGADGTSEDRSLIIGWASKQMRIPNVSTKT